MRTKKAEDLAAWRKEHFKELEECLKVAKAIRDNSEAKDRDRIDAIKSIARMLAALAPERMAVPKTNAGEESKDLNAEESALLNDLLHDINSPQ